MSTPTETPLPRQRLAQLFEYLKAYSDLRYPPVRDIDRQDRVCQELRNLNAPHMSLPNGFDL